MRHQASYPAGSDEWIGNRCASSLHCHARVMSGYQGTQQSTHQTLEWILSIEGLRYSNSVSFLPLPLYSICSDRSNLILPRHSFTQLIVLQWFLRVLVQIESKWVESCFRKAHYVFRCFEMTCERKYFIQIFCIDRVSLCSTTIPKDSNFHT